jgi:hypothetical protein
MAQTQQVVILVRVNDAGGNMWFNSESDGPFTDEEVERMCGGDEAAAESFHKYPERHITFAMHRKLRDHGRVVKK